MSVFVVVTQSTESPPSLVSAIPNAPGYISSKVLAPNSTLVRSGSTALALRNHLMDAEMSHSFVVLELKSGVDVRGYESDSANVELYDWLHENIRSPKT